MNSTGYAVKNIGSNAQHVQMTASTFCWNPTPATIAVSQNNTNYAPQVTWDHTCGLHPHKTYSGLPSHFVIKPQYSTLSVPRCFQEYYGGSNKDFYKLYDDQGVVAWGTTIPGSRTVGISSPWSQTFSASAYSYSIPWSQTFSASASAHTTPWYQTYVSTGSISAGPWITISDFIGQRPNATVISSGNSTLVYSGQFTNGYW